MISTRPLLNGLIFLIFTLGLLSFSACTDKTRILEISGTISDFDNSWVLLREVGENRVFTIDSTSTNDSGEFAFSIELPENPMFVMVQFENELEPIVLLVEHGERIELFGKSGGISRNYRVVGSKGSTLVQVINNKLNQTVAEIDSLSKLFRDNREHPRFDSIKLVVDSSYNKLLVNHKEFTVDFIKGNRYSMASVLALYQQYDSKRKVLNQREDFELFRLVDSSLFSMYPNNKIARNLHENVKDMEIQLQLFDKRNDMIDVDEIIPLVEFPLLSMDTLTLMDLRIRYTLIDFWATWCKSCIPNISGLKSLYSDYKPKGFEIIQFSIDEDRKLLTDFINRDSLIWIHASDFKMWESPILDTLHINSVPANYLVDRNGKVVARNLNPAQLREQLQKLLP